MNFDSETVQQLILGAIMALLGYDKIGPWIKAKRSNGNNGGEDKPAAKPTNGFTKEHHDELCSLRLEAIRIKNELNYSILVELQKDIGLLLKRKGQQ